MYTWLRMSLGPENSVVGSFVTFQDIAPYYLSACWEPRCGVALLGGCIPYTVVGEPRLGLALFLINIRPVRSIMPCSMKTNCAKALRAKDELNRGPGPRNIAYGVNQVQPPPKSPQPENEAPQIPLPALSPSTTYHSRAQTTTNTCSSSSSSSSSITCLDHILLSKS